MNLFIVLLVIIFLLLLLHFIPDTFSVELSRRFHLDREGNVPAWFATILLFSVSICSFIVHKRNKQLSSSAKEPVLIRKLFWLLFSSVYLFLSLDEGTQIHELLDLYVIKWYVIYAPIASIFFMLCLYYVCRLNQGNQILRTWIIGGLIIFAIGGLGMEMAWTIARRCTFLADNLENVKVLLTIVEEGLELIGTSMILVGCLYEIEHTNINNGTN